MKKIAMFIFCLLMALGVACTPKQQNAIGQETEKTQVALSAETEQPTAELPEEENTQLLQEKQETDDSRENESVESKPEPTAEPTPEPTEAPTPTPKPAPRQIYGAPQSFKPTRKLEKSDLPVVYNMYNMNPNGKKEAQMFTFDLNGDGNAEKISFKLDYTKDRTTITAGKIKITLKDGVELIQAMLIDLDPTTPYTDLVVTIDEGSDDYLVIPLHIEKGKFVRGEALYGVSIHLGSDGFLYRYEGTDQLGTQSGKRSCYGERFTPDDEWLEVSLPTDEDLKNYKEDLGDYGWFLQVKRELPCTINGKPTAMPVGTILYMTRFHESRTLAEVRTLDGMTALIAFTMDENDWPYLIDGIPQDEYFQYALLYAD